MVSTFLGGLSRPQTRRHEGEGIASVEGGTEVESPRGSSRMRNRGPVRMPTALPLAERFNAPAALSA